MGVEAGYATRYLNEHPEVRRRVLAAQGFLTWRSQWPRVRVDESEYYVVGGDILLDDDELVFEWAKRSGLLRNSAPLQEGFSEEVGQMANHEVGRVSASTLLAGDPGLRAALAGSRLFARLRTSLRTTVVDGTRYYVAEGDLLFEEAELGLYALRREGNRDIAQVTEGASFRASAAAPPEALVAMVTNGKILRWQPILARNLAYRVVRHSFPDLGSYELVSHSMREAAQAWEATCGVRFHHRADLDEVPGMGPDAALFSVRWHDDRALIASAFFPHFPRHRRFVLITPRFFAADLGFDRIGVLRHELGHVLGFRHEHIRSEAPPDCPGEDLFDAQNLTKYDPRSVMHYFCGGVGSRELEITSVDRTGSEQVYGPPLGSFDEVAT